MKMIYKTVGILTLTLLLLVTGDAVIGQVNSVPMTAAFQSIAVDTPITGNSIKPPKLKIAVDTPITGNSVKPPKLKVAVD
ncbi:MAG: hypothetical protein ABF586_08445, partial [Sporolactobacillus sp.]